jgi:hypothetical protein
MAQPNLNMAFTDLTFLCTDGKVETFRAIYGFCDAIQGALEQGWTEVTIPFEKHIVETLLTPIHNSTSIVIEDPATFEQILLAADYLGILSRVAGDIDVTLTSETISAFFRVAREHMEKASSMLVNIIYRCYIVAKESSQAFLQAFHVVSVFHVLTGKCR